MRTRLFLTAVVMAGACFGQGETAKPAPPEPKFYHLDFVVKEVEAGKVINSRAYATTISTDNPGAPHSIIRSGAKVPMATQGGLSYQDVGTNIDCFGAKEVQNQLSLAVSAEISSAAIEPPASSTPVVRQVRWNSALIVPLRKPTTIFSSDDPTSKRTMQLELTATPIK